MALIGRRVERADFLRWICSDDPELICIYGRRRIGKTFFVNELLADFYAFDASGLADGGITEQLRAFHEATLDYGGDFEVPPKDWWEAFRRLKALLDRAECPRTPEGKRVVFLDEFPWFDTPRSNFLDAFSDFWNRWAQRRSDVKVIICGSATSWILREVLRTEGALNRRVTNSLYLAPLTLKEVEEFLQIERGIDWSRQQIIECYMTFGGTPYYLKKLQARLSLAENITALCLREQAPLRDEGRILLDSTLSHKQVYYDVLTKLGETKAGMARAEIVSAVGATDGQGFSAVLMGLEECGYIKRYENPYRKGRKTIYQLVDPFLMFSMRFMNGEHRVSNWLEYYDTPSFKAWRGNAFETVCTAHLAQMKHALSLSTMATREFPWSGNDRRAGAQIDLVIERPDKITYICEMKCTDAPFAISAEYSRALARKREVFREETQTKNSVQIVMVTSAGLARGTHTGIVSKTVEADDLFVF